jgi:hypothetical protein
MAPMTWRSPAQRRASRCAPACDQRPVVRCVIDRIEVFGNQAFAERSSSYGNVRPGPEERSMKYLMILPVLIMLMLEQKRVVQVATRRLRRTQ